MTTETKTAQEVGTKIGNAIARDTIDNDYDLAWTGITAEDADWIPEGMDMTEVEAIAKEAYKSAIRNAE